MADLILTLSALNWFVCTLLRSGVDSAWMAELLKHMRANPGKITYGVTGPGSPHQLATLLMSQLAGGLTGMTEVQYKGSTPAHPDVISNRITFMIDPLAAGSPHIRSGALRALAVSTPQRNPSFPDVPAVAEILSGYDFASWGGVFAPAGTLRGRYITHPAIANERLKRDGEGRVVLAN